jgi:hypothetical protein
MCTKSDVQLQPRHGYAKLDKKRHILLSDGVGNVLGDFDIVGMRRFVAAFDHFYPGFTIVYNACFKSFARGVAVRV